MCCYCLACFSCEEKVCQNHHHPPPLPGSHQIRSKRIAVSHVLFWQNGWYSARGNRLFIFNSLSLMIVEIKTCKAVTQLHHITHLITHATFKICKQKVEKIALEAIGFYLGCETKSCYFSLTFC